MTHLVVKANRAPRTERLVPMKWVIETIRNSIRPSCTRDELTRMEPFIKTEWVEIDLRYFDPLPDEDLAEYSAYPYTMLVEQERIPPGELAVHRHVRVKATDKQVGRVDEFLVNPADGRITHLVLRRGLLWGRKNVSIPVSEIGQIGEGVVHLQLDKSSVESLPATPVRRK